MKVYISGPITGTDDYMARFWAAQIYLEGKGYEVVNPASENSLLPKDTSWREYMGESLKMVCGCDAIFMMRNWIHSRGAKLEYVVATHLGMKVMEEES